MMGDRKVLRGAFKMALVKLRCSERPQEPDDCVRRSINGFALRIHDEDPKR
jgi:hypothetical protein